MWHSTANLTETHQLCSSVLKDVRDDAGARKAARTDERQWLGEGGEGEDNVYADEDNDGEGDDNNNNGGISEEGGMGIPALPEMAAEPNALAQQLMGEDDNQLEDSEMADNNELENNEMALENLNYDSDCN